jgi:hypothetical protein
MYAFMAMTGVVVAVGYVIKGQPLFSGIWTAFGAAWAYRVWRTPAWRSDQGD